MKGNGDEASCNNDQGFSREDRLRSGDDFRRIYHRRCSVSDDTLIVYAGENDRPRLGLSVSRKVGNAVVRNRWKRMLRDVFRRVKRHIPNADYVVIPRRGIEPNYERIASSFPKLAHDAAKRLDRKPPTRKDES